MLLLSSSTAEQFLGTYFYEAYLSIRLKIEKLEHTADMYIEVSQ